MNMLSKRIKLKKELATSVWFHVQSYGNFPYENGTKCVNSYSAYLVLAKFHSILSLVLRYFKKLPVVCLENSKQKICGRISDLEVRHDGIWVLVSLNQNGCRLYHTLKYKMAIPSWRMKCIGNDTYEPDRLLSVELVQYAQSKEITEGVRQFSPKIPITNDVANSRKRNEGNNYFLTLVNARMAETGEDYTTAWRTVKKLRQDIFEEFFL
ncbi:MAG: hypothetical protein COZ46_07595 [Verrucomicrobia bacterium CG_4_10_14_3_um_filter_43_23]|nr:MAG: hypothetical protein COZ46_07595 [Verrucomicrobia bacterium CG_4_10_14_3_um_filter_43_23]PJA44666.1 MAG: hypothetical protein CO175_01845 [Verrucomicrobia bacterium CG_4_9_14_3_um_filter_43_20]